MTSKRVVYFSLAVLPRRFPRICPLCDTPGVINLSSHLKIVHDITGPKRSELLKEASVFWELKLKPNSTSAENRFQPSEKRSSEPRKHTISVKETQQPTPATKRPKFPADVSLATEPYPEFRFRHEYSLLVVGPTQSGKTYFVKQMLTSDRIFYETKKQRRISWYYNLWQDEYEALKTNLGKEIQFFRGLPKFHDDLREINPKYNNVLVFDDLNQNEV